MKMTFDKLIGFLVRLKSTKGIEVLDAEASSLCPFCLIRAINFTIKKDCSVNIELVCNDNDYGDSDKKPLSFNIEDGAFNGDDIKRGTVEFDINARINQYYGGLYPEKISYIGPAGFDNAIVISYCVVEGVKFNDDRVHDVDINLSIDFFGKAVDILDDSNLFYADIPKVYVNGYADKKDYVAEAMRYLPLNMHEIVNDDEYRTIINGKEFDVL